MKTIRTMRATAVAKAAQAVLLALAVAGGMNAHAADNDVLAIGDEQDSSVRFFDAQTGKLLERPVITPGSGGLLGPRGILFDKNRKEWIVANQNVNTNINGEIFRYNNTGTFLDALIPRTDPNGPFVPRGIAMVNNKDGTRTLFVADLLEQVKNSLRAGKLLAYRLNGTEATFIANLDPNLQKPNTTEAFHPRGVVLGPDGYLYVSLRNLTPCGGSIVRFDPEKLAFIDVLLSNPENCNSNVNDLHRPEGLVFSPTGDLYVTSFQKDATDTDKILIIPKRDRETGQISLPLDRIDLDSIGGPRSFAQALLFGPDGYLFVPVSTSATPALSQGEVRRYNVQTKAFWTFVPVGRGVNAPQFLSFRSTNPATLAYEP